jgi:hypothetical protein
MRLLVIVSQALQLRIPVLELPRKILLHSAAIVNLEKWLLYCTGADGELNAPADRS